MNEVGRVEMDGYIRPGCAWMWMDGSWKKREVVAGEATTTWSEPEGGPVNAGRRRDHHQQHYSRAP